MSSPPLELREGRPRRDTRSSSTSIKRHRLERPQAPLLSKEESENRKMYRALGDSMYYGPRYPEHEPPPPSSSFPKHPTHLGPGGSVFSGLYEQMTELECYSAPQHLSFDPNHPIFKQIPDPSDYESFFSFEQAYLKWKTEAQISLNGICLTQFLGRSVRRPRTNRKHLLELCRSSSSGNILGSNHEEEEEGRVTVQKHILDLPLWDSVLIPDEPLPEYFEHFEDYSRAMINWFEVVNETSDIIPPHASQLKDLIPVQYSEEKKGSKNESKSGKDSESSQENGPKKTTLKFVVPFFEPMELNIKLRRIEKPPLYNPPGEFWNGLPQHTKEELSSRFHSLIETKFGPKLPKMLTNLFTSHPSKKILFSPEFRKELTALWDEMTSSKNNAVIYSPLLPIIHGTFPEDFIKYKKEKKELFTSKRALRRIDVMASRHLIQRAYDCPLDLVNDKGHSVEFNIPPFELVEQIDFPKLSQDINYFKHIVAQLKLLKHRERKYPLNSWYHPKIRSEVHSQARQQVDGIIMNSLKRNSKLTVDEVISVLTGPMYLDRFQSLLSEDIHIGVGPNEEDGMTRTYASELANADKLVENIEKILQLYELHENKMIHAKVSFFLSELFLFNHGKLILQKFINAGDIRHLSLVSFGMTFLSSFPVDLFPYRPSTVELATSIMGKEIKELVKSVFIFYYLGQIPLDKDDSFIFIATNQFFTESQKNSATIIAQQLYKLGFGFLGKIIIKGLGNRSSTCAYFSFFILLQLMSCSEDVKAYLRAPEAGFVQHLRVLCCSKYSHSQFIAKRLFLMLLRDWREMVNSHYFSDSENRYIKQDLFPQGNETSSETLSQMVLDMATQALEDLINNPSNTLASPMFLLEEELFHYFLNLLIQTKQTRKELPMAVENVSKFLAVVTYAQYRRHQIFFKSKKALSRYSLGVTLDLLDKIVSIISWSVPSNNSSRTFVVKTNLLSVLRHILKDKDIFDVWKKDQKEKERDGFMLKLSTFCRDHGSVEFNRNAWRQFYQLIRYHHGILDSLIKNDRLNSFLEIVGTSAGIIMMNGLHYITKLFSILQIEQHRVSCGKPNIRNEKDFKSFEKDVKALSQYFVNRRIFIKIHMIYKRYDVKTVDGRPFHELAKFYNLITTSPACSKLHKDIMKKEEYRLGLQRICSMIGGIETSGTGDRSSLGTGDRGTSGERSGSSLPERSGGSRMGKNSSSSTVSPLFSNLSHTLSSPSQFRGYSPLQLF